MVLESFWANHREIDVLRSFSVCELAKILKKMTKEETEIFS